MHINQNSSGDLPYLSPQLSPSNGSPIRSPFGQKLLSEGQEVLEFRLQNYDPLEIQEPNPELLLFFPHEISSPQPDSHELNLPFEFCESQKSKEEDDIEKEQNLLTKVIIPSERSKIQTIIQYLVENSKKPQEKINQEISDLILLPQIEQVFYILLPKFKKLKKTKEQMTKYCMRKAFKFITDHNKNEKSPSRNIENCMKKYFETANSSSNINIPFKYDQLYKRKNSSEKTMNGSFLKKIFAEKQFVSDYQHFLDEFPCLVKEDNQKKIKYLSNIIQDYITNQKIKKIQSIKRLPWTKEILQRTIQLGESLMSFSHEEVVDKQ